MREIRKSPPLCKLARSRLTSNPGRWPWESLTRVMLCWGAQRGARSCRAYLGADHRVTAVFSPPLLIAAGSSFAMVRARWISSSRSSPPTLLLGRIPADIGAAAGSTVVCRGAGCPCARPHSCHRDPVGTLLRALPLLPRTNPFACSSTQRQSRPHLAVVRPRRRDHHASWSWSALIAASNFRYDTFWRLPSSPLARSIP